MVGVLKRTLAFEKSAMRMLKLEDPSISGFYNCACKVLLDGIM